MKLSFDYYRNLEKVDLFLCNPNERELFPLQARNRNLTLRFNDLSELTFEFDSKATLSDGTVVDLEAYDYIETKRLIFATNIGWFNISNVEEYDNGISKYKKIIAESYQSVLKNKGFISEERVYRLYNPVDPKDDDYDFTKDDAIPSVVGQCNKQLGIEIDLSQGLSEPSIPYEFWTITYISNSLKEIHRTFKENTTFGYDWLVNDVEKAFEAVVLFDFMYKTIHILAPGEITEKANVIYTFNNFMKKIDVKEDAKDIVTVLNCNGDNCDITMVNPTGTNYICDFSYYMDKVRYRWMSSGLIRKLESWIDKCTSTKPLYEEMVSELRNLWLTKTKYTTELQSASIILQDLKNAQTKRSVVGSGVSGALCGIVTSETVKIEEKSLDEKSRYNSTAFTGNKTLTAYKNPPEYNSDEKKFIFDTGTAYKSATADSIISGNFSDDNTNGEDYWYFFDVTDGSSYCKLKSAAVFDESGEMEGYRCDGFDRYIAYCYPNDENGTITYTDSLQSWIDKHENVVNTLNKEIYGYSYETENPKSGSLYGRIKNTSDRLDEISSELNILSYFSDTPSLLRELNCYWIEGDYTNENIAVLEETTPEEEINLSNELLESGRVELSKVCQPHFSFSIESIDATKSYEFKSQMTELELGKIITIEKEEGLWYYPALLEISMNLDNCDNFSMKFANSTRLDDWGYTYADLISSASSTSRKVSANWQNLLAYVKDRETISSVVRDPLNSTLRASVANMVNQDFVIDKNGILGRKRKSENSEDDAYNEFENEQVRLINNLLIFTDDNWATAKTALGKVYYEDEEGNKATSYGLLAETIIGELLLGNKLLIKNSDNSVIVNNEGITIKSEDEEGKEVTVFEADTNGNITLSGNITWDKVNNPVKVLYHSNPSGAPTKNFDEYQNNDYYDWHKTLISGVDLYLSYSYDGGKKWGDPIRFAGKDGGSGKSAYELAREEGYEGTLEEWLESLKGKDGKPAKELSNVDVANLLASLDYGLTWMEMYDKDIEANVNKLCIKGDYIVASDSLHLGQSTNNGDAAVCLTGYCGNTSKIDPSETIDGSFSGYYGIMSRTGGANKLVSKDITEGICMTRVGQVINALSGRQEHTLVAVTDSGAKLACTETYHGSYILGNGHAYSDYFVGKDLATVYVTMNGDVGIEYKGDFKINGGTVTFELVED